MTADDYVKAIEAALAMRPTPGEWSAFVKGRSKTVAVDIGSEPSGRTPCVVHWTGFDCSDLPFAKQAANAHLIAACNPVAMRALLDERRAMQAKIDALMLEFCPGEMTAEQVESWASHQKAAITTTADNQEQPKGQ